MAKPMVAIIGKPNVGKSTFFNYIVGQRLSIVEDMPGVTRDRVYGDVTYGDVKFLLVDTGGIDFGQGDFNKDSLNVTLDENGPYLVYMIFKQYRCGNIHSMTNFLDV